MSGHARTYVKLTLDDYLRLEWYLRSNGEEQSPGRYAALEAIRKMREAGHVSTWTPPEQRQQAVLEPVATMPEAQAKPQPVQPLPAAPGLTPLVQAAMQRIEAGRQAAPAISQNGKLQPTDSPGWLVHALAVAALAEAGYKFVRAGRWVGPSGASCTVIANSQVVQMAPALGVRAAQMAEERVR